MLIAPKALGFQAFQDVPDFLVKTSEKQLLPPFHRVPHLVKLSDEGFNQGTGLDVGIVRHMGKEFGEKG